MTSYLPSGVAGGIFCWITGQYGDRLPRRTLLVLGQLCMIVSGILLALARGPEDYWPFFFPAMVVGMSGLATAYVGSTVVTMAGARDGEQGVVGAVLYTSYQIGSTIGVAIATAVTLGVNDKQPLDSTSQYLGYAASFWSLVAMHGIMVIITLLFVKN